MVISTFQVAESMGFDGDFRQWEHLCASASETRKGLEIWHTS
jgi:hypothetical protein